MQGLMSSYPLTLTHVFQRAERLFPEKGIATVRRGGIERDRPTASGPSARAGSRRVLDTLGDLRGRPRRHVRLEHRAPPRALLRRAVQRPRPAHAEHPPVPGRHRLHRQPRRGRGRLRRPLAAEALLAAGRPLRDRQARRRDGRRRRRRDPRRPARARLRGAAGEAPSRSSSRRSRTRTRPPRCVTRAARPATRRASSTRTARPSCTRWARWSPTPPAVCERDTIMPVVPMFHANAWGLCQAAVMAGADAGDARPEHAAEGDRRADGGREGHAGRGRADDLDGRAARAQGPRPVVAARDPVRRLGRAAARCREAYREQIGLPILQAWGMTETSARSPPPAAIKSTLLRPLRGRAGRPARRAGHRRSRWWTCGSSTPAPTRSCRGTARRAASCRRAARGSPPATTTTSARRTRSPRTAGCAPATSRRSRPNGYVRLVDRTKDLVKSGGEWISSVELENAIMAHPKVAEAAVIGIPDEKWSERPLACVVPEGGEEITLDELKEFLAERVPKWWIPNDLEIIDEVPEDLGRQVLQEDAARAVRGAQDDGLNVACSPIADGARLRARRRRRGSAARAPPEPARRGAARRRRPRSTVRPPASPRRRPRPAAVGADEERQARLAQRLRRAGHVAPRAPPRRTV